MVSQIPDVPALIGPVLAFLNTVDLRTYGESRASLERDQLADPAATALWLAKRGFGVSGADVSDEVVPVREIRERLRSALLGQGTLSFTGLVEITIETGALPEFRFRRGSRLTVAIETLIIRAAVSPDWQRLRVCAAEDCRQAFYDASRNRRSRWCSMKTCGNRMKTRSYRRRSRGSSATATSAVRVPSARRARTNTFRREGDYWTIASAGRRFRLKDSKGLRSLARLLAEPHREFHVMDLLGPGISAAGPAHGAKASYALLDDDARSSYKARLTALQTEIEEAESWADAARVSRAREEMQFVAGELQKSTGIGGRDRSFTTDSERARVSVTRVIKAALTRIADESPELKHHFASTVRTGTYCSYNPDPRLPVRWEL